METLQPSKKTIVTGFRRLVNAGFTYPRSAEADAMVDEWRKAIIGWEKNGIPNHEFLKVITEIIACERFWPKPIDFMDTWKSLYCDSFGRRLEDHGYNLYEH